jgi:hypothetical protein
MLLSIRKKSGQEKVPPISVLVSTSSLLQTLKKVVGDPPCWSLLKKKESFKFKEDDKF